MITNLTQKLDLICNLPRLKRNEVSKILKDCYNDGKMSERNRIKCLIKKYDRMNTPLL